MAYDTSTQYEFEGLSLADVYKLFHSETLGSFAFQANTGNLTRIFHVAELKYDDVDVRLQYGFPNPDYPALIKRNMFVMDIDAYVQAAHTLVDSLKYMETAHDHIQAFFENAATDELKAKMNG